jgi:hypothetical protein
MKIYGQCMRVSDAIKASDPYRLPPTMLKDMGKIVEDTNVVRHLSFDHIYPR